MNLPRSVVVLLRSEFLADLLSEVALMYLVSVQRNAHIALANTKVFSRRSQKAKSSTFDLTVDSFCSNCRRQMR